MCQLTIIIVNTNARELVCQCLESVYRNAPRCEFEVIVVDNASTDGSCETIATHYPEVRLIRNERNLGFATANNKGFEIARGKHIMLLNSDTIVLRGSIDLLLSAFDRDRTVGVVAPKLIYPDGTLQMSYGPMPSLFVTFCSFFEIRRWVPLRLIATLGASSFKKFVGSSVGSYAQWLSEPGPRTGKLDKHDLITAACMLIRDECFKQVGTLDRAFFICVDDADYCKRVHDAGWEIEYLAEATVVHIKGGTLGNRYRWTSPAAYQSVLYFLRKHRGRGVAFAAKVMAITSLGLRLVAKWLVSPGDARDNWQLLKEVAAAPLKFNREVDSNVRSLREDHGRAAD
jgi:GT2 family glycosyltransferase